MRELGFAFVTLRLYAELVMKFNSYSERISFLKKISGYHFDAFKKEEEPYRILGHFYGLEWMKEVEQLLKNAEKIETFGFGHCVACAAGQHEQNPQFDLSFSGEKAYSQEHVFLDRVKSANLSREETPILFKIIDWFELEHVEPRLHIQYPGQVFPIHVDGLMKHHNEEEMAERKHHWVRFQVQLTDWVWGHVWAIGNTYWKQWRAGEILFHPWWYTPHGTANCGFSPRYSLQITGLSTVETRRKILKTGAGIDLRQL